MIDEAEAACARCRFWQVLQDGDETGRGSFDDGCYSGPFEQTGRCRRNPPSTRRPDWHPTSSDAGDAAHSAYWPVTWDNDWCGEFSARLRLVE